MIKITIKIKKLGIIMMEDKAIQNRGRFIENSPDNILFCQKAQTDHRQK